LTNNSLDLTEKFPTSNVDAWQELVTAAFSKSAGSGSSGSVSGDTELPSDSLAEALQSLTATTLDGIDVGPIYTRDDLDRNTELGEARRQAAHVATADANSSVDEQPTWDICQKVREGSIVDGNRVILEELVQGATSVHLALSGPQTSTVTNQIEACRIQIENLADLQALTEGVHLNMIRMSCEPAVPDAPTSQLWQWWKTLYVDQAVNVASAKFSLNGNLFSYEAIARHENEWQTAANNLIEAVHASSELKCDVSHCAVDTREVHHLGGNNIQELAFACSIGLEYLRLFQKEGIDLQTANRQIVFHLAIDADFFANIAKLRALRELWSHLLLQCDEQNSAADLRPLVHAHTSLRMLSTLDADNNQLRNTIACAAAALGGADIVSVEPHKPRHAENPANSTNDVTAIDPFPLVSASRESRRTARNIQHVLMAESQLHRVQDPMGGSAFIEQLTSQMTAAAWELFQSLEKQGDAQPSQLNAVVKKNGALKKMIMLSKEQRLEKVINRKLPMVGVSEFATAASQKETEALTLQQSQQNPNLEQAGTTSRPYRDAQVFEALRARVSRLSRQSDDCAGLSFDHGNNADSKSNKDTTRAHVLLACFGTPVVYRARAGFARNLFASAGIACDEYVIPSQPGVDAANEIVVSMSDSIINAIYNDNDSAGKAKKLNHSAVVLCADNKAYLQLASKLASELESAGVGRVVLAGKSADAGVSAEDANWDQEIFMGCNVYNSIDALLNALFTSVEQGSDPKDAETGAAS